MTYLPFHIPLGCQYISFETSDNLAACLVVGGSTFKIGTYFVPAQVPLLHITFLVSGPCAFAVTVFLTFQSL